LVEVFKNVDLGRTGRVSSIEFKNVLMRLNIGITSSEINYIMNCTSIDKEGYVNWESFVNKLQLR